MVEQVILVDQNDIQIGVSEKISAHQKGLLHRAFSVFLYRKTKENNIEILLQQRHSDKYHCGGLWTNACCSHPRPGENILDAAKRRLNEELGIKNIHLEILNSFIYRAEFINGLIEHEYDYVLLGEYNNFPDNPDWEQEICAIKWVEINSLKNQLDKTPENFTPWLFQGLNKLLIEGIL